MGLFALPAARLARRVGSRAAVAFAVAWIGVFGIVRAAVPGAAAVVLLTLPVGIGMGLGNALMPAAVKERFVLRPGFATGVYATGINLGSAVSASLAVPIAHAFGGWRASLLAFSAVSVLLAAVWLRTARGEPKHVRPCVPPHELPWRSPLAWRLGKQALHASMEVPLSAGIAMEGRMYGFLRTTEDFREGVTAFTEKRRPRFKGQ